VLVGSTRPHHAWELPAPHRLVCHHLQHHDWRLGAQHAELKGQILYVFYGSTPHKPRACPQHRHNEVLCAMAVSMPVQQPCHLMRAYTALLGHVASAGSIGAGRLVHSVSDAILTGM
jgi:hypothetical protein